MSAEQKSIPSTSAKSILRRFGHLVSAQGVDGLLSTALFLFLAWRDQEGYGQVMYALAAGSIVYKIIQFGLYYPIVSQISRLASGQTPLLLNQANLIKLTLLAPTMMGMAVIVWWRNFSVELGGLVMLVTLGSALEGLAETFFARLRLQGQQAGEARIKIIGSIFSYGYGLVGVSLGWPTWLISFFKVISGLIWLGLGVRGLITPCVRRLLNDIDWPQTWRLFRIAAVFALTQIVSTVYNKTNIFFMEKIIGVKSVALYSAAYSVVEPISVLASDQLLGSVVFPMLAILWWRDRVAFGRLVHGAALWLHAIAWPIMFLLFVESDLVMGLIYPSGYHDAAWMQQYLVLSIWLSFETNLFAYVMMVTESVNLLLVFYMGVSVLNLIFNLVLINWTGLAGGCLVIVLTKLAMTILTLIYCQIRFRLFRFSDLVFPGLSVGLSLFIYYLIWQMGGRHVAISLTILAYVAALWHLGPRYMGEAPRPQGQKFISLGPRGM